MKFDIKNYPGNYVMLCRTEEQDEIFRKYIHSIGRQWRIFQIYLVRNVWRQYKDQTCYNFNKGMYGDCEYYESHGYNILNFEDFDWSDFMKKEKQFTKKDLKNGDVIKINNGTIGIVIVDTNSITFNDNTYGILATWNDDLTAKYTPSCDIVAVRRPNSPCHCMFDAFQFEKGTLVYERKEVEEMTLEEVCKALGKEIKIVKEK